MLEYRDGKYITNNGEGTFEVDAATAHRYYVDTLIEMLSEDVTDTKEFTDRLNKVTKEAETTFKSQKVTEDITIADLTRLMDAMINTHGYPLAYNAAGALLCDEFFYKMKERHEINSTRTFYYLMRDRLFTMFLRKSSYDIAPWCYITSAFYNAINLRPPVYINQNRKTLNDKYYVPATDRGVHSQTFAVREYLDLYKSENPNAKLADRGFGNWNVIEAGQVFELTEIPVIIAKTILDMHKREVVTLSEADLELYNITCDIHRALAIDFKEYHQKMNKDTKELRWILNHKSMYQDAYKDAFNMHFYAACYSAAMLARDGIKRRRITMAINAYEKSEYGNDTRYNTYFARSDAQFIKRKVISLITLAIITVALYFGYVLVKKMYGLYTQYGEAFVFGLGFFLVWMYVEYIHSGFYAKSHGGHVGIMSNGHSFIWY